MMRFKVSINAEGTPREGASPPSFAEIIPAGFFTTRYVAARDVADAEHIVRKLIADEIGAFGFWSTHTITIEKLEPVSLIDYALNSRKKGASWYAE